MSFSSPYFLFFLIPVLVVFFRDFLFYENAVLFPKVNYKNKEIIFTNINYTNNFWKTLFFDIETSPELIEIHRALLNYLPNKHIYQFLPHISLIYKKLSLEQKTKIMKKIISKKCFTMNKIAIVQTGEDVNSWKICYLSKY